jgi:hypothetical protein
MRAGPCIPGQLQMQKLEKKIIKEEEEEEE